MIQNYMELLVADILQGELSDNAQKYTHICQCPACMARIQAEALNHLPPFYTTSTTGNVFGEYKSRESQNFSDIITAIGRGLAETERNPFHTRPLAPSTE